MPSVLESLLWRLKQRGYWAAFLGLFLPYFAMNLWGKQNGGSLSGSFVFLSAFLPPLVYLVGMVWISPFLWQLPGKRKGMLNAGLLAFLAAQVYMIMSLLAEAGCRTLAGEPFPLLALLPTQMLFHAPAMTLVGGVLAAREALGKENKELLDKAREAQARALQGQLHPHVLFNALNGLAELIYKKSDKAEDSVRHLSDLLRQVLRAADDPDYTLSKERNLLEDYLDMEGLRLGKRLRLGWDWDSVVEGMRFPPLLLQPLVENALKHGIAPCREGGELRIQARCEGPQVVLCVRNTGMPLASPSGAGEDSIGLANLRSRLELTFGDAASFSLRSEEGWTVAELRLPWVSLGQTESIHELAESSSGRRRVFGPGAFVAPSDGTGLPGGGGA